MGICFLIPPFSLRISMIFLCTFHSLSSSRKAFLKYIRASDRRFAGIAKASIIFINLMNFFIFSIFYVFFIFFSFYVFCVFCSFYVFCVFCVFCIFFIFCIFYVFFIFLIFYRKLHNAARFSNLWRFRRK